MSGFHFNCPTCATLMTADETESGMATICPSCSADVTIPETDLETRPDRMLVTTGDINSKYKILGVVFFSLGTRGGMATEFNRLKDVYLHRLAIIKQKGQLSSAGKSAGQTIAGIGFDGNGDIDFSVQHAGASFNSNDMEIAFHILMSELQVRATHLGADAIVGFRHNVELDSNSNVINFFANSYGTAVKKLE